MFEAYSGPVTKRCHFGTVGKLAIPSSVDLTELQHAARVLFRLKIVDQSSANRGRILGAAQRIPFGNVGDTSEGDRNPLLAVETDDNLGEEVWRLDLDNDDDGPLLKLNSRIPDGIRAYLGNRLVVGSILPVILRLVLKQLVTMPSEGGVSDEGWRGQWMEFYTSTLGEDTLLEWREEEATDWIERCVDRFCQRESMMALIQPMMEGMSNE